MATLLISAAIQIGVGLLIGALTRKGTPTTYSEGPRMQDLTVTSSAYGTYIPILSGSVRASGNMIWSAGIAEHSQTTFQSADGGKGGGKSGGGVVSTTYSYTASFALAFCEGIASDIIRIWADSKLIYDKTGGSAAPGSYRFRFYTGTEDQLPDGLIEANIGAGRTPAYRGIAYMVAQDWPLTDFGNRIPNIECEIAMVSENHQPFDFITVLDGGFIPGTATGADNTSYMVLDPNSDGVYFLGDNGASRASTAQLAMLATGGTDFSGGLSAIRYLPDGFLWQQGSTGGIPNFCHFQQLDPYTLAPTGAKIGEDSIFGTGVHFENPSYIGGVRLGRGRPGVSQQIAFISSPQGAGGFQKGGIVATYKVADGQKSVLGRPATDEVFEQNFDALLSEDIGDAGPVISDPEGRFCLSIQQSSTFLNLVRVSFDVGTSAVSLNLGPDNTSTVGTPVFASSVNHERIAVITKADEFPNGAGANIEGWCSLPLEDAIILSDGTGMIKVDLITGVIVANNPSLGFMSQEQWTNNGTFAFPDPANNARILTISTDDLTVIATQDTTGIWGDAFSTIYPRAAYDPRNHSIILSRLSGGGSGALPANKKIVRLLLNRGNGLGDTLDDVVADICERAGLTADQYDVSLLTGYEVDGYALTRQGSARDGLQPLMQAYLFEGIESDWKMKFVPRGQTSIITIPQQDIGKLRDPTSNDPTVKETIQLETELPARFSIVYFDRDNDYQQGTQFAKRFIRPYPTQFANNETSLEISIVGHATDIKQLAERCLYTVWAERTQMETQLPWRYMLLDPGDVFTMTYQGEDRLVRMANASLGVDLSIDMAVTQQDSRSNESALDGTSGSGFPQQFVPSNLPTKLFLLDIPLLQDSDDGLQQFVRGYWAASGYDNSWRGTTLDQSKDEGSSFSQLAATATPCAWGRVVDTLQDPLVAGTTATWNEAGTLDVRVYKNISEFVTASEADVLSGANALVVLRKDGLCEIIQFQNVEQLDDSTVRLTRLLRGRRGTEPSAHSHDAGEEVVLLRSGEVRGMRLTLADLDQTYEYRAPTIAQSLEESVPTFFAFTGQDLMPYSPDHITGARDGSGNLTLNWIRRTRYNGTLRDNIGTVPLNEAAELYDVELYLQETVRYSLTDVDAPTASITAAEWIAAGNLSGDQGLPNGDFEITDGSWVFSGDGFFDNTGLYVKTAGAIAGPQSGTQFLYFGSKISDAVTGVQTLDLFFNGWTQEQIDNQQPVMNLDFYYQRETGANNDTVEAKMQFYAADGTTLLGTATSGAIIPPTGVWTAATTVSHACFPGTRYIKVSIIGTRAAIGLDVPNVAIDNLRLTSGVGVPRVEVKVYQKSAIVGRGREGVIGL